MASTEKGSYGSLKSWAVEKWTKKDKKGYSRLSRYHRQLNEITMEKSCQV